MPYKCSFTMVALSVTDDVKTSFVDVVTPVSDGIHTDLASVVGLVAYGVIAGSSPPLVGLHAFVAGALRYANGMPIGVSSSEATT